MIDKVYLLYLSFMRDVGATTPIDSLPTVREFTNIFPTNMIGMPPYWNIDFDNDMMPGTQPIYIPPYRMEPA